MTQLEVEHEYILSDDELLGVLASLTDLSRVAHRVQAVMRDDSSTLLQNQSIVLKTFGDDFLDLADKFRTKLIVMGEDLAWSEVYMPFVRHTNSFDVGDVDTQALLASLAAYTDQQERFLISALNWNVVGSKIIERALMLADSMKNWAIVAENQSRAS